MKNAGGSRRATTTANRLRDTTNAWREKRSDNLLAEPIACKLNGGGSGIRTHGTVSRTHAFQASALSHSAIPPLDARANYTAGCRRDKRSALENRPPGRKAQKVAP